MSIKSKLLAGAAALALVGGVGTVGAMTAAAATPSCGQNCIDIFSRAFGTHRTPNFVMDVLRQGAKVGQPIILFRTSNTDPAEDFVPSVQGTTADFYAAGLVSAAVALHYGCIPGGNFPNCGVTGVDDPAWEFEYAPFGVDSGLCVGVAATATQGEGVTLQPCGVSAKTVWIEDDNDSPATARTGYVPLINGSDTNFSHPFVLSYPGNGFPTDKPRPQLQVKNLTGFSHGIGTPIGSVDDTQLWGADFGVLR
ncbi:MAG TPA: hypothetical protein VFV73_31750 [Streptosporangiaceae bacterium]|nr:hypothetical protein [Streptosporangiaceae bacterium]